MTHDEWIELEPRDMLLRMQERITHKVGECQRCDGTGSHRSSLWDGAEVVCHLCADWRQTLKAVGDVLVKLNAGGG